MGRARSDPAHLRGRRRRGRRGALPQAHRTDGRHTHRAPEGCDFARGVSLPLQEPSKGGTAMKLTPEQLKQFDDDGYLFFPNYFSPEETAILKSEIPGVFAQRREENVREKTGDVVRTAFAVHTWHPVFEALIHHPAFVGPAEQLLGDQTYIHQFKINGKAAFDGDVWQWHQDYGTWKADDDMPEARAMNLAVFIDEVNEFNGPLWFIPRSHKKGAIDARHDLRSEERRVGKECRSRG